DPCIDQAVVCGEGKNFLTALLVPHWDNVRAALKAEGITLVEGEEARAHQPAGVALLERVLRARLVHGSDMGRVKKFVVRPRARSVAAEEMTVSLKLRRNVIMQKYAERLEALYR